MKHKLFNYNGTKVYLEKNSYASNDTLAVSMLSKEGELVDVITTNLCNPLQSDSMAFLDTNNCPNIEKFIQKNGLGLPMGYTQRSGFCEYPLYTLFTSAF